MQKIIRHLLSFGFMCALCFAPISSAMAATLSSDGCTYLGDDVSQCNGLTPVNGLNQTEVCPMANSKIACFQKNNAYVAFKYCNACQSGQTLTGTSVYTTTTVCGNITYPVCKNSSGGSGGISGSGNVTIACQVPGCSSDTTWGAVPFNPGYMRKVKRVCRATICNVLNTDYQCANGYYQSGDITCSTSNFVLRCSGCTKKCTEGEVKTETDNSEPGYITTYTCNDEGMYVLDKTPYKCAKGYYGKANYQNNAYSGCTRCPLDETIGQYGTTAGAGTENKKDCYLPAGTYTDTKGTFTVSDKKDGAVCNQTTN